MIEQLFKEDVKRKAIETLRLPHEGDVSRIIDIVLEFAWEEILLDSDQTFA
jgi:hypothetical protein